MLTSAVTHPVVEQKNKATSYHLGQLRSKLAKLQRELIAPSSSGGGPGIGFDVARTGIASVGFIGFPSVGKSTLMSGLTGTTSEVAAYEFTTLTTVPGTMDVHGAKLQILDLPGIIEGAKDGKGRGRQVIAVARTCNLIFIVLDVCKPLVSAAGMQSRSGCTLTLPPLSQADKAKLEKELEGVGIRLNKTPPNIVVRKKDKGGISVTNVSVADSTSAPYPPPPPHPRSLPLQTVPLTQIDADVVKAVCNEYKIASADIAFRCDGTVDELIE